MYYPSISASASSPSAFPRITGNWFMNLKSGVAYRDSDKGRRDHLYFPPPPVFCYAVVLMLLFLLLSFA